MLLVRGSLTIALHRETARGCRRNRRIVDLNETPSLSGQRQQRRRRDGAAATRSVPSVQRRDADRGRLINAPGYGTIDTWPALNNEGIFRNGSPGPVPIPKRFMRAG